MRLPTMTEVAPATPKQATVANFSMLPMMAWAARISALTAMWPMMAVITLTPRPHMVSLTSTGEAYFTKSRVMVAPGRSRARGRRGTRRSRRA